MFSHFIDGWCLEDAELVHDGCHGHSLDEYGEEDFGDDCHDKEFFDGVLLDP
jgi:hypothetical protein